MLNFFMNLRRRRETIRELSRLSDRCLADLGFARVDIGSIAEFAARNNRDAVSGLSESTPVLARLGDSRLIQQGRLSLQA